MSAKMTEITPAKMTKITSAMDDNQPSHEGKDVAGFGSPPPPVENLYATNNPFLRKGPKGFIQVKVLEDDSLYVRVDLPGVPDGASCHSIDKLRQKVFFSGKTVNNGNMEEDVREYSGTTGLGCDCCKITSVKATMEHGVLRMTISRVKVKDQQNKCTLTLPPFTGKSGRYMEDHPFVVKGRKGPFLAEEPAEGDIYFAVDVPGASCDDVDVLVCGSEVRFLAEIKNLCEHELDESGRVYMGRIKIHSHVVASSSLSHKINWYAEFGVLKIFIGPRDNAPTTNSFLRKGPKVSKDSSLPFDVVENIISRAPIESLLRCKPTCKDMYALCNNKRFIYKHLDLSEERLMRIYVDKAEIFNPATLDLLSLPLPAEFNGSLTNLTVIHCNGLLLCRWFKGWGPGYKVAVWNPVLGHLRFVESASHHLTDFYGFGYSDNHVYKILRVGYKHKEFEIYDFKSKLWRAFSATLDWCVCMPQQNVSMNGNMYWLAETRGNRDTETFIQSFDFSKETFKPIHSFPFKKRINALGDNLVNFVAFTGFRGDRLSLFHQCVGDETREMEVWVTNRVTDGVVSWSKYFNITRPDLPVLDPCYFRYYQLPAFFIDKTNSIMLWCDKVVGEGYACTSFYEIGQGEIKKQVETRQPFRAQVKRRNPCISTFVYVPSLVTIPE